MRRSCVRSEEGSALILVLALLTILSLALGALFANAGANLTMSTVVTRQDNKVYAADGGVEYAIQQLRANSSLCSVGGPPFSASTTTNGHTVDVTCSPTAGLASSVSPWALVTTDIRDRSTLLTPSGPSQAINGPVYIRGNADLDAPVTVTNGDVLETGACPGSDDPTVSPPAVLACRTTMPIPDPRPALPPSAPKVPQPAAPALVYQGCSIWKPGLYQDETLALGTDNYFASGIYYFDNTSISLSKQTAIGGQPGPDYQQTAALPPTACSSVTDKMAGVTNAATNGAGVEFILGGTSVIVVHDPGDPQLPTQLELFARMPGTSPEGTPGISIRTVPSPAPTPAWDPTATGNPTMLLSSGINPRLAVHGYVYVPQGVVSVDADYNVPLSGGLICWQVTLNTSGATSGDPSGTVISAQDGAQPRYVTITSKAHPLPSESGQDVTSTAVVRIGNDGAATVNGSPSPGRTIDVQSWVTQSG